MGGGGRDQRGISIPHIKILEKPNIETEACTLFRINNKSISLFSLLC